ncbi:DUF4412 domain-containing protein [Chlamydiota bacterium]
MKRMLFFIFLLVLESFLYSGVIIEQTVSFPENGIKKSVKRVLLIEGARMRTEYPDEGRYSIILLDEKIMYDVDTKQRIYQMINLKRKMKKEKRRERAKRNEKKGVDKVKLTFTLKEKKINNYNCRLLTAKNPTGVMSHVWVSHNAPGQEDFFSFYKKFNEISQGVRKLQDLTRMISELAKLNSMPIEICTPLYGQDGGEVVSTVTAIYKKDISKDMFKKPRGFKRIK